ncbi:MAG: sigma-70 family RNA polymerase sigma factor [Microvirga sp.]
MSEQIPFPLSQSALHKAIQAHLGEQLRAYYGDPTGDRLPSSLRLLADRVAQVIRAHTEPVDRTFINGVMSALPALRAFAISLTRNGDQAEDLIQDTVLKAISKQERFEEGTNLQAWLFTILRNNYFTIHRKTSREVADTDGIHAAKLETIPGQEDHLMIGKLQAALVRLPQEQRNALLLVGLEGVEYEDAAIELGCAVGTIKSRVNRARTRLAELLALDDGDWGRGRGKGRRGALPSSALD